MGPTGSHWFTLVFGFTGLRVYGFTGMPLEHPHLFGLQVYGFTGCSGNGFTGMPLTTQVSLLATKNVLDGCIIALDILITNVT